MHDEGRVYATRMGQLIVAFTGHRPNKLSKRGYGDTVVEDFIQEALEDLLGWVKPNGAITGMAQGVDQIAARACIKLRIPFTAAVPFRGQESIWPPAAQAKYHQLLKQAEKVIYTDETYKGVDRSISNLMQHRNEYLVDQSSLLIGVWDGSSGGTANCIRYAQIMDRLIYLLEEWPK